MSILIVKTVSKYFEQRREFQLENDTPQNIVNAIHCFVQGLKKKDCVVTIINKENEILLEQLEDGSYQGQLKDRFLELYPSKKRYCCFS